MLTRNYFEFAFFILGLIYGILFGFTTYQIIFPCPDCIYEPPIFNLSCPEPKIPKCPDCICPEPEKPKLPSFIEISKNMAEEHEYDFNSYNCDKFSKELVRRLRDYGWNAKYCYGKVSWNDQYYHAWVKVEVPIEATTGKILEPSKYKNNYEEYWCK